MSERSGDHTGWDDTLGGYLIATPIIGTEYRKTKRLRKRILKGCFASMLVGLALAGYIGYDWVVNRVGHEVLAIATAAIILVTVQVIIVVELGDLIIEVREAERRRTE